MSDDPKDSGSSQQSSQSPQSASESNFQPPTPPPPPPPTSLPEQVQAISFAESYMKSYDPPAAGSSSKEE